MLQPCVEGDTGHHVEVLQVMLRASGFEPGEIDGVYGPKTSAAVLAMRKSRGSAATTGNQFNKWAYEQLLACHALATVGTGAKGEKGDPGPAGPPGPPGKDGADGTLVVRGAKEL